jgi:hypothetical protein
VEEEHVPEQKLKIKTQNKKPSPVEEEYVPKRGPNSQKNPPQWKKNTSRKEARQEQKRLQREMRVKDENGNEMSFSEMQKSSGSGSSSSNGNNSAGIFGNSSNGNNSAGIFGNSSSNSSSSSSNTIGGSLFEELQKAGDSKAKASSNANNSFKSLSKGNVFGGLLTGQGVKGVENSGEGIKITNFVNPKKQKALEKKKAIIAKKVKMPKK